MTTNCKKPRMVSNLIVGGGHALDLPSLRRMAKARPKEFFNRTQELIDAGEFRWGDVRDLRALFNAFCDIEVPVRVMVHGQVRTIMSSAFPVLSGNLSVAEINAAYDSVPTIGERLVSDIDSMKETLTIVGLLAEVGSDFAHTEGEPYKLVGAGEERFDIGSDDQGLRMQVTQKMIDRNDVEGIVQRLNFLGEVPADDIEEKTLKRVTDHDGSAATPAEPYAIRINKTGAALYRTNNTAPFTRLPSATEALDGAAGNRIENNAFVDYTDLSKARKRLVSMKNTRGKKIAQPMSEAILLCPESIREDVDIVLNSTLTPGVENERNPWGPQGSYRPTPLSSPKLDELSTSAWYLGRFNKQFKRKWGVKLEMVTQSGDLATYLRSRVAFEARVAWDVEVGATDYVYVVQNLNGTTAPKDE